MQPANKVTITNKRSGLVIDEVAKAFAAHVIYSKTELYSTYDKFLLAFGSRDINHENSSRINIDVHIASAR